MELFPSDSYIFLWVPILLYSTYLVIIIYLQDHIFMIKVITTEEVEQMHYLLKYYHPYVVEQHGKTLLPQFLGKYTSSVFTLYNTVWLKTEKNSAPSSVI